MLERIRNIWCSLFGHVYTHNVLPMDPWETKECPHCGASVEWEYRRGCDYAYCSKSCERIGYCTKYVVPEKVHRIGTVGYDGRNSF